MLVWKKVTVCSGKPGAHPLGIKIFLISCSFLKKSTRSHVCPQNSNLGNNLKLSTSTVDMYSSVMVIKFKINQDILGINVTRVSYLIASKPTWPSNY